MDIRNVAFMLITLIIMIITSCQSTRNGTNIYSSGMRESAEKSDVENDNNSAEAYYNKGIKLSEDGDFAEAEIVFTDAIIRNNNWADPYAERGYIRLMQGKFGEAIIDLNNAIELDSNHAFALNNRGWLYVEFNRFSNAVLDASKAISLSKHPAYYDTRAWAYYYLEDYKKARNDAEAALQLDQYYFYSRALLFRLDVEEFGKEAAIQYLRDYVSELPLEQMEKDDYLLLQYFLGHVSINVLKDYPQWFTFKTTLKFGYDDSEN